ncbi:MAG: amidohydrolase family protein [Blastocatellia bacterium]|nr:amidohydrolase family protein [Blastocatellia bacterium]MCS7156839.1 amidohydrolase family protein [Blastocatellia bacterium]MCX7752797.1 amidohydrolase family protein [Blastocatellia bacterium]MDW8167531.1 amidohydrolase family protein [Acidobacteriota bacterium]MDW8256877.1 amidohydrolase family protein [Acidobacteriota bacterium]
MVLSAFSQTAPQERRGVPPAPDRRPDEGEGPFERLIIRGATLIDGTGAPPIGPVDIVIEGNRIKEIRSVGYPGVPIREAGRPQGATREINAHGMYVLPGFVDLHGHIGGAAQGTPAEYVYKLWMAHGITTVRDPGSGNGVDWTLRERERSAKNQIVAPRIFVYVRPGMGWDRGPITTPELAREYVRWAAAKGVDGLKLTAYDPEIMAALIDEAKKHGLGTAAHLAQTGVARMNALDAARLGLTTLEHWYGLPEALFADRTVQDFPYDYNYNDEQHRFGQAGRLWKQAAPPGSPKWNAVMDELIRLGLVLDPTLSIYEASRDLMRAMRAEWHDTYTLPSLWEFYQPNREAHGSFFFYWTTQDEIEWKNNYRLWMAFVNEYKNRGGRVTTGSDSGFIFKLYGFDYIRELELLQEAGFHPLEVIRSATLWGAEALFKPKGKPIEFGVIRPGMLADLILVEENPIQNLKVLYGTGAIRLNDQTRKVERVGGVKYTIKDGIIYDAKKLLADVARMVAEAKRRQVPESNATSQGVR